MRKVSVPDEGAESLYGPYDENLKHLESLFNVRIRTNAHEVIVEGEAADVARAENLLGQLSGLIRGGYRLAKGDVRTASQLVEQDEIVGAILQLNGRFADAGGIAGYENRKHRWAWGAQASQIPYLIIQLQPQSNHA